MFQTSLNNLILDGRNLHYGQSAARLKTKWAPVFFRAIFNQSKRNAPLTYHELQKTIAMEESEFVLHRTQTIRMLDDIQNAIAVLDLPLWISFPARNKSGGPWQLLFRRPVTLDEAHNAPVDTQFGTETFFILPKNTAFTDHLRVLREFLTHLLNYDALCLNGLHSDAIDTLMPCYDFAISPRIEALLNIRLARTYRLIGYYAEAKARLTAITDHPKIPAATSLAGYARFQLNRLLYDEAPAEHFSILLANMQPPQAFFHEDSMTLLEWHNLRGLLMRRQIENSLPRDRQQLHQRMLCHFMEALFHALRLENAQRIHDILINIAFCQQQLLSCGFTAIPEVIGWYNLSQSYADKTGISAFGAWSRIFFTQFFLEHYETLDSIKESENLFSFDFDPREEKFYLKTLEELEHSGDLRQTLVFYLCYFRFSRLTGKGCSTEIASIIRACLEENPEQRRHLEADGYQETLFEIDMLASS